ncbi:MAG: PAS domain-containing protein [Clostridia bacterium]
MFNEELLRTYIPIADYIQSLNCGNSEVLIHNLENQASSVFYIVGNITNRKLGAPLTQYAVDILNQRLYENHDFISGYTGRTDDGKILMRSSTMFIRNGSVIPIGLLCVNIDVTKLVESYENLENFVGFTKENSTLETISPSPETVIDEIIVQMQRRFGVSVEQFSKKQKLETVRAISASGLLRIKGVIHSIARMIFVSEKTIYRYMTEIENIKNENR